MPFCIYTSGRAIGIVINLSPQRSCVKEEKEDAVNMMGILEISIYGNLLRSWLALIGVVAVVTLSVAVARRLVMQRFTARPPSPGATPPLLFEVQKLRLPVVLVMALYGASRPLIFPERVDSLLHGLAVLAVFVQVASWADLAARFLLARYVRTTSEGDGTRATTVTVLGILARLTLLTILLLVTLENLGDQHHRPRGWPRDRRHRHCPR